MKVRLAALLTLAIGFALSTFAQQKETVDPQLRQVIDALDKKNDEAFNKGDAAALAALYTEDAIEVTDQGPIYGRDAIEKHYSDLFQKIHFTNYVVKADQYSPHTMGNNLWSNGEWSTTIQGENFGPIQLKGYWSAIKAREGDVWKTRVLTWNVTPAPAAAASPTSSPSKQ